MLQKNHKQWVGILELQLGTWVACFVLVPHGISDQPKKVQAPTAHIQPSMKSFSSICGAALDSGEAEASSDKSQEKAKNLFWVSEQMQETKIKRDWILALSLLVSAQLEALFFFCVYSALSCDAI